jgi:hypothetical protein
VSSAMIMGPAFRQWLGTGVAAADDGGCRVRGQP